MKVNRTQLSLFFLALLILGLYSENWFRALPSISMGALFVVALFNSNLQHDFKNKFLKNKGLLLFTLVFWVHLASIFYTDSTNMPYLWSRIQLKLPFLLLPIAFALLPKIKPQNYYSLTYWFLLITSFTAALCTVNYFIHFDEMQDLYRRSKTMPVPVNHVRYSLLIAFATMIGIILYIKKYTFKFVWERKVILTLSVFLFLFLHLLSVRSGLLAFYLSLSLGVIIFMVKKKKYILGLAIVSVLFFLPIISYYTLPSFKGKIENTLTDLSKLEDEKSANNHSLTGRIFSYKVGWSVFKAHPVFGTGAGDIYYEIKKEYNKSYPSITNMLQPHNQYLRYLVAFGVVGFIVFMIGFYFVFFYKKYVFLDVFLVLQLIMASSSFMFEGTIETQLGTNYVIIFTLLPIYFINTNRPYLESLTDPWFHELEA